MTRKYRFLSLFAAVLAFFLCACSAGSGPAASPSPSVTAGAAPVQSPSADEGDVSASASPSPDAQSSGATVTQCTAWYFPDIQGSANLYAAVEFRNDSACDAVVGSITVNFTVDGKTVTETFTPPCAECDVVAPGAVSTAAGWFGYSGGEPSSPVTAVAEVSLSRAGGEKNMPLNVDDLLVVQNYPDFATVSGRLTNDSEETDYALTMVYLSFYDANDALLGVQLFTKDLTVKAGDSRYFVYHLRSLPIEGLTENTAKIVARGTGIS